MFSLFLFAQDLSAGWKISRVERTDTPYIHFDGDLAAYRMDDDLIVYMMSSGQKVSVTDDQDASMDTPLEVKDGVVWFCSSIPGPPDVVQLRQYLVEPSQTNLLYTTESGISLSKACADAGRLVVEVGHDWWIWHHGQMEQITFTGGGSGKQNPCLSGDHLLWREGQNRVFLTHIPSGESTLLFDEGMENSSLQLVDEHAAWVSQESSDRYRIIYHQLGSEEFVSVGMSDQGTAIQVHMDSEGLVYLMRWGGTWFIMRFRFEGPALDVLLQTGLALENLFQVEDQVFFLAQSCSTGMCLELFSLDVTTGALSQITTYGILSYVCTYGVGPQGVLFSRFIAALPEDFDIFKAKEVPGLACGTLPEPAGKGGPMNLCFLFFPALFAFAWLFRIKRLS